jgi:hypothetical protein
MIPSTRNDEPASLKITAEKASSPSAVPPPLAQTTWSAASSRPSPSM